MPSLERNPRRRWGTETVFADSRDSFGPDAQPHSAAERMAADWQIVMHLRTLIERDPGLVGSLLRQASASDAVLVETVYAAAREALANRPNQAEFFAQAALAALALKRWDEAGRLMRDVLRLEPDHAAAQRMMMGLAQARGRTSGTVGTSTG
jgi:hypothetical protein